MSRPSTSRPVLLGTLTQNSTLSGLRFSGFRSLPLRSRDSTRLSYRIVLNFIVSVEELLPKSIDAKTEPLVTAAGYDPPGGWVRIYPEGTFSVTFTTSPRRSLTLQMPLSPEKTERDVFGPVMVNSMPVIPASPGSLVPL